MSDAAFEHQLRASLQRLAMAAPGAPVAADLAVGRAIRSTRRWSVMLAAAVLLAATAVALWSHWSTSPLPTPVPTANVPQPLEPPPAPNIPDEDNPSPAPPPPAPPESPPTEIASHLEPLPTNISADEALARVRDYLATVGITSAVIEKCPHQALTLALAGNTAASLAELNRDLSQLLLHFDIAHIYLRAPQTRASFTVTHFP